MENHAFNELTPPHHLTPGRHPPPGAILAGRLILVLGLVLFERFVRGQGKLGRAGRVTLQEVAQPLDREREHFEEWEPLGRGER